jgi:hypothetical protein
MKLENYKKKIKSLVLTRACIDEKLAELDIKRADESNQGIYFGPAAVLYFELFDEKYEINAKLGKIQSEMLKAGFSVNKYCELHNYYINLSRGEI